MFLNSTASLESRCEAALQLARAGNIPETLDILASIRWQRSLLDETSKLLSDPSSFAFFSDEDLRLAEKTIASAPRLQQVFQGIDTWITQSFRSFDEQQLMDSSIGVDLFVEHLLPNAWLYGCDIVVLKQEHHKEVHESLIRRGQQKFIVIIEDEESYDDMTDYFCADDAGLVLLVSKDTPPTLEDMKSLADASWPKMVLLSTSPSDTETAIFDQCHEVLRAACIQTNTRRWLPQLTCEQYLTNLPVLVTRPSVMSLNNELDNADIMIVSPGPSLNSDLNLIRRHQTKFVIIAALKAVDTLLDNGIKPDLAIWQDPRDHSSFLPSHPEFRNTPLIISECCHKKFFEAAKSNSIISNDPHLINLPTTDSLHGRDVIEVNAASVSTMACVIALKLGCRSITLVGQDLNISEGTYVSNLKVSDGEDEKESIDDFSKSLFCEGIDGVQLRTLPNYLNFIEEFKQIAVAYASLPLYNCTSHGAYLDGWKHLTLTERIAEHSLTQAHDGLSLTMKEEEVPEKSAALKNSCSSIRRNLETWLAESAEMAEALSKAPDTIKIKDAIATQEEKLKSLLREDCSILVYYCAGVSQLVTDTVQSCQNVGETHLLSLDYYQSIDRAARKLINLCEASEHQLNEIMANA